MANSDASKIAAEMKSLLREIEGPAFGPTPSFGDKPVERLAKAVEKLAEIVAQIPEIRAANL